MRLLSLFAVFGCGLLLAHFIQTPFCLSQHPHRYDSCCSHTHNESLFYRIDWARARLFSFSKGEGYAAAAVALRPQLRNTLAAHAYYRKRLELARTQRRMEAEFGRQYFTATLNAVAAGKASSVVTRQQLAALAHAVEPLPPGLGAPGQINS